MLIVFILGFGISTYSLLYGTREFSWHLPREIINVAYWQIFGELNALDVFERRLNLKKKENFFLANKFFFYLDNYRANGYAVFILLIIYMAIVSILLVNLLIAMFRYKIKRNYISCV